MKSLKHSFLIAIAAFTLAGCNDDNTPSAGAGTEAEVIEKLFVSVEALGVVKSIHLIDEAEGSEKTKQFSVAKHAQTPTAITSTIHLAGNEGAGPGEMVFSGGNAYVRVKNTNTVQMFDVATDGLIHNHPINVGEGPLHLYLDPDKNVWVMNDGPRTPSGVSCVPDPTVDPACVPETVSFIEGGTHDLHKSIRVGSGHHKMAFSTASPERAFVSNIHDGTVSVIDNDPGSASYLETVLLNTSLNGDASIVTGLSPHGIDYASHNGKIYSLNTGEDVNAVSVIDPTTLTMTFITKGAAADQVPAVGRVHTRHQHDDASDGRFVYILANTEDDKGNADPADDETIGHVIVIDTMNTAINNGIIAKTSIPHMRPARIIFGPHGRRLYIPSGVPFGGGAGTPDLKIDQVAVIDIDPTSATFNDLITTITVGNAGGHGSIGTTSSDGHFLFIGNTGATTISVINTETLTVVGTIDVGGTPSGIGVDVVGHHDDDEEGGQDDGGDEHDHDA